MSFSPGDADLAPSPEAEELSRILHAAFLRSSERFKARCIVPPTGDAAIDRPVLVEALDGSDHYRGIVVAGECEDSCWQLDDAFTLLSLNDDGSHAVLVLCNGWNCDVSRI